ncbi:hypothetical protein AQUCO_00100677v1 [Aquilegia coerulea]|uniref:Uncharacterized protein n=1 Tax=Aquilegia coerulea TaxID=218851 RepID=A0A2G5FBH8_AQUCA|nr:hypothetical protein AQUCO_00100677v1 [Aquilegia coerulea]
MIPNGQDLSTCIGGCSCISSSNSSISPFLLMARLAGVFSHTEVFSCINYTFNQVSKYIVPYSVHIPSYADTWDGSWIKGENIISMEKNLHWHQPYAKPFEDRQHYVINICLFL